MAFAREEDEACVQVFSIRGGHLLGRENFILEHAADEEDRDVIRDFLQQFYGRSMQIPQAIFLPVGIRGAELASHVAAGAARRQCNPKCA